MNSLKTFILLAVMTALFGGAGYMVGGQQGMIMALKCCQTNANYSPKADLGFRYA